jgi:hypothetical protein
MRHALAVAAFVGLTFAGVTAQTSSTSAKRVETIENGRTKVVLYDAKGAVLEMTEQVQEKELPRPVFDAIHSHRRAIFVSALKVTRKGNVEYQITVRGSRKTAMVAKADGTVISFK